MESFTDNRKARYDYETLESFDAGIVLSGQEVKSIRGGGANLTGSYLTLAGGEIWIKGMRIAPYSKAGKLEGYDPTHPRKVLLRKREIMSLLGKTQQKGLTLVPLFLYPRGRQIKLRFGLCRGRKAHDKKEKLKARDIGREVQRDLDD
ncbi:MAG TPA: SsrA-binding protein SmpB [Candidatus Methylomirabilis sp.]|nr:SsrA-binding protein SmpB [Candidatus Methylomirabilis sp.]